MMKKIKILFLSTLIFWINFDASSQTKIDNLDATHYEIRITNIDFQEQTITASTTITLTPLGVPLDLITLELLGISDIETTGVWVDDVLLPVWIRTDSTIRFTMDPPLQPGDTIDVRINYNGNPFHETWGGFHFSGEFAFNLGVGFESIPHNLGKSWFPCIDNFTDRATYDVYCTLPEGKIGIGGGILVETIDNGNGTSTYHWQLSQAIPTYLASIAAGNYKVVRDTFNGINAVIPIDIFVKPQDTNKVEGSFIHLKDILSIFEECMGPYAWDRVGYTSCAIGSMEHATNIFIPHSFISGNTANEATIAHELAHMWMGDQVTCMSAEEMWINEGWATFFGMYYALALYGDEASFKQEMRAKHGGVLQYCHTPSGDGSYFPLNQIPQQVTYGMAAYDKGATVCQALRFYLGDSLFFGSLAAFIEEYSFNNATSYHLRDLITTYTGIDMQNFFENFVMNSGTPHYSIDSFAVEMKQKDLYDVAVFAKYKRKGPAYPGDGHVMEVMFMDRNWNRHTDTIHFNGPAGHSVKAVPFIPTVVLVDPEERMCDATTDSYKTIKTTGNYSFDKTFLSIEVESITDSAFIQVTHNWAPPDSLREPVAGLRLSDYHYWRIGGIIPEELQAKGKFTYSATNYIDNTLITSSSDTLIILYRKGAKEDWQEIEFEKVGPWNVGNIIVPNLKAGEYTFAVKEPGVGINQPGLPKKNGISVYPNPSSGGFVISASSDQGGELRIYNDTGILVRSFFIAEGNSKVTWTPERMPAGSYIVKLIGRNGEEGSSATILLLR